MTLTVLPSAVVTYSVSREMYATLPEVAPARGAEGRPARGGTAGRAGAARAACAQGREA